MRLYHKRGAQVHELADVYGVSRQCVWKIVTRRTHKRVLDLPDGTNLTSLRRLLSRIGRQLPASTVADARPTPPADPPPLPVAPPERTAEDRDAAALAHDAQRREDAAKRRAEKLEKDRLLTDRRQCPVYSCSILHPCPCHSETSVADRAAASASCIENFCRCTCHSGKMPAIVQPSDVPDHMLR